MNLELTFMLNLMGRWEVRAAFSEKNGLDSIKRALGLECPEIKIIAECCNIVN